MDRPQRTDFSLPRKLGLLAVAWFLTCIASLIGTGILSMKPSEAIRNFIEAMLGFPVAICWLVEIPLFPPAIGWVLYSSLTVAALATRRRMHYWVLYAILCVLLACNVVGCHRIPNNLM